MTLLSKPKLWCKKTSPTVCIPSNKTAIYLRDKNRESNVKIENRVRAVARKTTDIRRAIMSEVPRKVPKQQNARSPELRPNLKRKKDFLIPVNHAIKTGPKWPNICSRHV